MQTCPLEVSVKAFLIPNPNPISDRAVRIHAISVASAASRLRSLASLFARFGASGLSLTFYSSGWPDGPRR